MPEITEQQLKNLQASDQLLRELMGDDTKLEFERLVKKKYPKIRTTEDDLAPAMNQITEVKDSLKKIEERFAKQDADKLDAEFFAALDDLQKNHGLTAEGTEKLKQIMKDKVIPDPYVAFNHMRATEQKPQAPSSFAPTSWGFGAKTEDKDLQHLFTDEDSWAEKEAQAAWNDAQQR